MFISVVQSALLQVHLRMHPFQVVECHRFKLTGFAGFGRLKIVPVISTQLTSTEELQRFSLQFGEFVRNSNRRCNHRRLFNKFHGGVEQH